MLNEYELAIEIATAMANINPPLQNVISINRVGLIAGTFEVHCDEGDYTVTVTKNNPYAVKSKPWAFEK